MSVSAEPAQGFDGLKIGKVGLADGLQYLGSGALLQTTRQCFQPGCLLLLQHGQLGYRVPPTLGAAAMVDNSTRADDRHANGTSSAAAGLAFCGGHGCFTDRLAGQGFHSEA